MPHEILLIRDLDAVATVATAKFNLNFNGILKCVDRDASVTKVKK